jgi:Glycoside-hydrolase family GH114
VRVSEAVRSVVRCLAVALVALGSGMPLADAAAPFRSVRLPPGNAGFDYQLGDPYRPPPGTRIVARDRSAAPAARAYNICYVNAFQTQPRERGWWLRHHPSLILRDIVGRPVEDSDWPDEYILDITTETKRTAIAGIVGSWIDGCARSGFDAVEFDNLDTYVRFPSRLDADDAAALARRLVLRAHLVALAAAQKNAAELTGRRTEIGFDFAIAEQCGEYDECRVYTAEYGDRVLVIEYRSDAFAVVCRQFPQLSVVLRDRTQLTPTDVRYRRSSC